MALKKKYNLIIIITVYFANQKKETNTDDILYKTKYKDLQLPYKHILCWGVLFEFN